MILSADRFCGGVVIKFGNGMVALFPASFLHASLCRADEVLNREPEERSEA
jgi:hypothetical protein